MIRRFFDAIATEPAAPPVPVNIAEMLAKHGAKTDDSSPVTIPDITIGPKLDDPPPVPPAPKAETAQEPEKPAAPPASPAPEPVQEPPRPAAQAQPTPPAEPDWREVLKKQSEVEVYKQLGLDEKMINFLNRWRTGEDLKDYLEAITVDYNKLTPEQLMRFHMQREYSALSPEDFEELYKMKVIEQYKLDPDVFDEKEVRRGKLLLSVDAEKVRQDYIKRQQELLFAKPPEPVKPEAQVELERLHAEREQDVANYKRYIEQDTLTRDILANRLLKIGDGDSAYNYEVQNPQNLLDILYNPDVWASKIFNQDGTPNVRKQMLLAAIVDDDNAFLRNYAKHHEMLGAKKVAEQLQNPSPPPGTPSKGDEQPQDPVAALARAGVITSGE